MSTAAQNQPPLLREGDQLTADQFLQRWEAMPDLKFAELIDGIVHMPSPVSYSHSVTDAFLTTLLGVYALHTPGCEVGSKGTWLMSPASVPQPDITLRILPEKGGQSRNQGAYTANAPELIVEVAVSSSAYDLNTKFNLYERMNVSEYLIALTGQTKLVCNRLTPLGYVAQALDQDGIFRSKCLPRLWLDSTAPWSDNRTQAFAVLQEGLASSDHSAFVSHLASQS